MSYCGVYSIQSNIKPNRIYIGHSKDIENRWRLHKKQLQNGNHHSPQLQRHYNKYGLDDLVFEIICECDKVELLDHEQFYIDSYNPYFNCAQIAGSTAGYKFTEDQRKKLRGRTPWNKGLAWSDEIKVKMSKQRKGIKKSPEYCEKCRQIRTGWKLSEETKQKISKSHIGIINSTEAIEKIRQANLGRKNPHTEEWNRKIGESQKGRKLTEEHKAKLRKAKIKYVPWNKGVKTGKPAWNKGMKLIDGEYIKANGY